MAGHEAAGKGPHSKPTKSKERSVLIRPTIRVVLWDESPEDEVKEDDEKKNNDVR
jgi:hypothetical protein